MNSAQGQLCTCDLFLVMTKLLPKHLPAGVSCDVFIE